MAHIQDYIRTRDADFDGRLENLKNTDYSLIHAIYGVHSAQNHLYMNKKIVYSVKIMEKERAPRNRTLTLTNAERQKYKNMLVHAVNSVTPSQIANKTLCGGLLTIVDKLPSGNMRRFNGAYYDFT